MKKSSICVIGITREEREKRRKYLKTEQVLFPKIMKVIKPQTKKLRESQPG